MKGLKNLTAEQLKGKLQQSPKERMLIDVREPGEFQSGHIPGAVNIPLSRLKEQLHQIPKDTEVLLYCRSGMRSKQAAKILAKAGYRNLFHLAGGIAAWTGRINK